MRIKYKFKMFGSGVKLAILFNLLFLFLANTAVSSVSPKILRVSLLAEPPNLDTSVATDADSFALVGHLMEGLTRYGAKGQIAPGVAERWVITDKGATFYLRSNARWSDGKPVTAHDFVYSWRRALDPKTASEYAFILYPIKNGEKINEGKLPLDQLGVIAKDAHTLEVLFEQPCGYFLGLTSFATYLPLREDFIKRVKDTYASSPETMLYNGPFQLTSWVHGASLRLERNNQYWAKSEIKLDIIDIPYITPDASARFNLFKTQKIDIIQALSKENLSNAQREGFRIKKFAEGTIFYILFNMRPGLITANKNLRKAISLVLNRNQFVSRVVGIPGTLPGLGLVPTWMQGVKTQFRKEFPLELVHADIPLAKQYLAKAMEELKLKEPPKLVWLTTDTEGATREAEFMQSLLKSTLGIDLRIDKQIFKQRLAKMKTGEFEMVSSAWGPDYADPLTFVDLMASWNGNNAGLWKNATYDSLVRKAMSSVDPKVRMSAMAQAEKIVLEDLGIIPTYERMIMYTHAKKVHGVQRRPLGGDPDFTHVEIIE